MKNLFNQTLGPSKGEPVDPTPCYLEGTVLLETVIRFGRISYEEEDVNVWDQRWEPSGMTVRELSNDWMFKPLANIRFVATANGGVTHIVRPQSIAIWLSAVLRACILGVLRWLFSGLHLPCKQICIQLYQSLFVLFPFLNICEFFKWLIEEVKAIVEQLKNTIAQYITWLMEEVKAISERLKNAITQS